MTFDFQSLPPHWAIGECQGELVAGAHLPTRDGRRTGNAHIVRVLPKAEWRPDRPAYTVLTDAGNVIHLTGEEIAEMFYQPTWIADVHEVLTRFARPDSTT